MKAETIEQAWLEVFPNSHAESRQILGSCCVALRLLHVDECFNRIGQNDPLMYNVWIEGDNVRESDLNILTEPTKSHMVYGSAKMRKQTIKNADHGKLVRRFRKVRDWIKDQNMKHDISGKV